MNEDLFEPLPDITAKPDEIMRFWTGMMLNNAIHPTIRLKASEHLARAHGMFTERHQLVGAGDSELFPREIRIIGVRPAGGPENS